MGMFSLPHILYLLFFVGCTVALFVFTKKMSDKTYNIVRVLLGAGLMIFQGIYFIYREPANAQLFDYLPIELCTITGYVLGIATIFNKKELVKIACFWGFTGGVLSMLVCTVETGTNAFHIRTIQYFTMHYLLMASSALFILRGEVKITYKDLVKSMSVLLVIACFITLPLNSFFHRNFMYLSAPPKELAFAGEILGGFYTPAFCLLVMGIFHGWYFLMKHFAKREELKISSSATVEKESGISKEKSLASGNLKKPKKQTQTT